MHIAIDMQGAQSTGSRSRGIGRYTRALTQAIVRNRDEHEIFIALSGLFPDTIEPIRAAFDDLLPQENIRVWQAPGPVYWTDRENDSRRRCAELIREAFLADLKPDVTLVSSLFEGLVDEAVTSVGTLNRTQTTAAILFDLIPLIHRGPYLEDPVVSAWYENKLDHLRRADLLLAISEATRQDGIALLGFPAESCVNISTAADPQFRRIRIDSGREQEIRRRLGIEHPFVMYTGGIDHRKNVEGLIRAYASLSRQLRAAHQLVIVCSVRDYDRSKLTFLAKQQNLSKSELVLTGFLPEDDLVALYNLCKVFVFPSWHEGFGLPALEAMSCGAPTLGSNCTSIPEVIGRDDALFDPRSDRSIAEKLQQVLTDDSFRAELKDYGLEQARRFSWDRTAQTALKALEALHEKTAKKAAAIFLAPRRPKLAYVSPLPPVRSGISDYSAELLPELSRHYEIEVIVSQETVSDAWVQGNAPIRSVQWFKSHADRYDRVLYHFGNSPFHRHMFPLLAEYEGVVVLHDFFLANVLAEMEREDPDRHDWKMALYRSHGYAGLMQRYLDQSDNEVIWSYPSNLDVLQSACGVIVHSQASKGLAEEWYGRSAGEKMRVVPFPRVPTLQLDRRNARENLGLAQEDFLVCSFGMLGPTKLNDRLLSAWMASSLANDPHCRMVFVGDDGSNDYGANLLAGIPEGIRRERISITGWTDRETYKQWLSASNVGVQLRSLWRGETSAAVLDCMNYGLATIVNAVGSTSELPQDAVWMLGETFSDEELIEALETLRADHQRRQTLATRARAVILKRHQPRICADRYVEAIEAIYSSGGVLPLTRSISRIKPQLEDPNLHRIATAIARNHPPRPRRNQLLIDLSTLVQRDARTGIQRVVRAILGELLRRPPEEYSVEPVYARTDSPGYRYARRFTSRFLNLDENWAVDEPVEPSPGDIFLGLDLQHLVVGAQQELLTQWRNCGVKIYFCVYDLLCIAFPNAFRPGWNQMHRKWLETITRFDGAVCISRSVADELRDWLEKNGQKRLRSFKIGWFHLGADLESSFPTGGFPGDANQIFEALNSRPSFLMVGTLEPRKCHAQVLSAFQKLWSDGVDANLVIAGQQGWMVEPLAEQIRAHPEVGRRLFWHPDVSDEFLQSLYAASSCLIAASKGEGFGLPLIEAARHKLAIIARNIPVFREVAGKNAFYFSGEAPSELASAVREWSNLYEVNQQPKSTDMAWLTWQQSTERLMDIVLKDDWYLSFYSTQALRAEVDQAVEQTLESQCPERDDAMRPRDDFNGFQYLEKAIDFRGNMNKGPLSGKEVLVYSLPKTGSSTLHESIKFYLAPRRNWNPPEFFILHDHGNTSLVSVLQVPPPLRAAELLNRFVIRDLLKYKKLTRGHVQVVSSYRDPLNRAVSQVFQNVYDLVFRERKCDVNDLMFDECYEMLCGTLRYYLDAHHPLEEVEERFFEEHTFDHDAKCCYVDRGHYEILAVCLEHSSSWKRALERHFGYKGIEILNRNVTSTKEVATHYQYFKERLELPREVIDEIYWGDHPARRHLSWFYTRDEIHNFHRTALHRFGPKGRRG